VTRAREPTIHDVINGILAPCDIFANRRPAVTSASNPLADLDTAKASMAKVFSLYHILRMGQGSILEFAVPRQRFGCVEVLVATLPGLAASFVDAIQQGPIGFIHLTLASHKKTGKSEKTQQGKGIWPGLSDH